jgi:hypothetical protein
MEDAFARAESTDAASCARCGDYAPLNEHWGRRWCAACLSRRDPIELAPATIVNLAKDSIVLSVRLGWPALALCAVTSWLPALLVRRSLVAFAIYSVTATLCGRATLQRFAFLHVIAPQAASLRRALRYSLSRLRSRCSDCPRVC